jgi:hypothetical protein
MLDAGYLYLRDGGRGSSGGSRKMMQNDELFQQVVVTITPEYLTADL